MPTFESLTPDIPGVEKFFNDYRALFEKDKNSRREEKVERAVEGMNEAVRLTLECISSLVRDAEEDRGLEPEALKSLVTKASDLENTIIHWTFSQDLLNSFIPVFCGNDYSDSASGGPVMDMLAGFLSGMGLGGDRKEVTRGMIGSRLTSYKDVPTPGPRSSPLARFSMDERHRLRRAPLAPNASPPLIAFTQARCEITARGTSTVVPFSLASCDSMLAIIGPCGHKQRDPALQLFPLGGDHQLDDYFDYGTDVDVGLCSVGTSLALNESRKLAFVGDNDRIKSYQWSNGPKPAALPVHTLASKGYTGSILLRDGAEGHELCRVELGFRLLDHGQR
ncbi:hypothetical protein EWM64_g2105 [Hericium alpestre]|uniref:Uncharacterized protein n=1 Tax=Hericium alpestre TaxID=135208 RepID=A0A4Z0A609_9AGAM|nr:hypothetical protein EWM64_g2105 [Hericium alpestre]